MMSTNPMAMPTLRHALVLRPGAAVVHHTGLPKHMPFPRHMSLRCMQPEHTSLVLMHSSSRSS